ncbi:tetraacyldisaccharide 4'-kinase, partial [Reinekea sp.]
LQVQPPKNVHNQTLLKTDEIELVTAIGYGKSFLNSIEQLGYQVTKSTFLTDHAVIPPTSLSGNLPIVITEKDAVKLDLTRYPNVYVAPLEFRLPQKFDEQLLTLIREKINEKSSHYSS